MTSQNDFIITRATKKKNCSVHLLQHTRRSLNKSLKDGTHPGLDCYLYSGKKGQVWLWGCGNDKNLTDQNLANRCRSQNPQKTRLNWSPIWRLFELDLTLFYSSTEAQNRADKRLNQVNFSVMRWWHVTSAKPVRLMYLIIKLEYLNIDLSSLFFRVTNLQPSEARYSALAWLIESKIFDGRRIIPQVFYRRYSQLGQTYVFSNNRSTIWFDSFTSFLRNVSFLGT